MAVDVVSSHIMLVNTSGQLARGITFSCELRLRRFLHRWEGISVYNMASSYRVGLGKKKIWFYASKWLRNISDSFLDPIAKMAIHADGK
jgi:hypothetical protein